MAFLFRFIPTLIQSQAFRTVLTPAIDLLKNSAINIGKGLLLGLGERAVQYVTDNYLAPNRPPSIAQERMMDIEDAKINAQRDQIILAANKRRNRFDNDNDDMDDDEIRRRRKTRKFVKRR